MKAYNLAMFLLILNLMGAFISTLGVFNTGQEITADTGTLGDAIRYLNTNNIYGLLMLLAGTIVTSGSAYYLTKDRYAVKLAAFATVYWGIWVLNLTILVPFVPSGLLTIFTLLYGGVFIAAILQLEGGGWKQNV